MLMIYTVMLPVCIPNSQAAMIVYCEGDEATESFIRTWLFLNTYCMALKKQQHAFT